MQGVLPFALLQVCTNARLVSYRVAPDCKQQMIAEHGFVLSVMSSFRQAGRHSCKNCSVTCFIHRNRSGHILQESMHSFVAEFATGSLQASSADQETASTSGRQSEPQGVGFNNVLLALAAAYVLPGPLFPLVALTLPFWLSGKSRRRSRTSPTSTSGTGSSNADSPDPDWMSGTEHQQQGGFGFSDGPAERADTSRSESEADLSPEEQEASRRLRKQQQLAAFQQQQMLFNMMRMVGGGMMGGYRGGFGGPFGMRGGFRRGPFMF